MLLLLLLLLLLVLLLLLLLLLSLRFQLRPSLASDPPPSLLQVHAPLLLHAQFAAAAVSAEPRQREHTALGRAGGVSRCCAAAPAAGLLFLELLLLVSQLLLWLRPELLVLLLLLPQLRLLLHLLLLLPRLVLLLPELPLLPRTLLLLPPLLLLPLPLLLLLLLLLWQPLRRLLICPSSSGPPGTSLPGGPSLGAAPVCMGVFSG